MITVACVYRTGGDFDPTYVDRLTTGVRRHLSLPHRIVCLTNVQPCVLRGMTIDEIKPLQYEWPGWWSKIELFNLPGPVLYLDLDMVVAGSLDEMAGWVLGSRNELMMLRGFYRQDQCSGVMAWSGDLSWIADTFRREYAAVGTFRSRPSAIFLVTGRHKYRGDQEWLREFLSTQKSRLSVVLAQDVAPGIYSYKVHCKDRRALQPDARIVCFHGQPRPHQVNPRPPWLTKHWVIQGRSRRPVSQKDFYKLKRREITTTYPHKHEGTLLVLGAGPNALAELNAMKKLRPAAKIAAVGYAAGTTRVDFVVSDHYEVHDELRLLQDQFGVDHYTTHATFSANGKRYPAVDYWWRWRRSEASSVQTAIRMGLAVGFSEVILCGCPLEHAKIQHPLQRRKDGTEWPPPRNLDRYKSKPGWNTSKEILTSFRRNFVRYAVLDQWYGRVFSVSGFTRQILGPPEGFEDADVDRIDKAIKQWTGRRGVDAVYPRNLPKWPDPDAVDVLRELCRGRVCEVGCGTGRCAEAFEPDRYVGLDINQDAVKIARETYPDHRFETIDWDDGYPPADTYLFYTVLLHIPDTDLIRMLKRTKNGGDPTRLVIFETMDEQYRSKDRGNYQRNPEHYVDVLEGIGRKVIEVRELPSAVRPFKRHFMVAE